MCSPPHRARPSIHSRHVLLKSIASSFRVKSRRHLIGIHIAVVRYRGDFKIVKSVAQKCASISSNLFLKPEQPGLSSSIRLEVLYMRTQV